MIIKKEVVWLNQSPYPDHPGEPNCLFYPETGLCGYGSNCRFNHPTYATEDAEHREELPERVGQPNCGKTAGDSFDLYYGLLMYNVKAMAQLEVEFGF
ncbi:hypothetical protein Pint_14505 [Pistacia integerrima]|uniref:Uncharacterized protein n=1 Tax=Pistacia integerrima TaxID=434235 RepID=A0ACC0Y9L5_9ROSI|nr:hypothetical protein Pint_14505 [Pistacia integerrima]